MTLLAGSVVAGYRIEALIGSGSVGSVYSAEETALGRRVALKILAPSLARDERFRERFLRESRIVAGLEHPNVIPVYAAGEADGELYLAMRYIDGRDLAALLRSLGRLDPGRVLAIATQLAGALDVAHAQGLVHRDVKPANILLAHHGNTEHVYLCDFGLAKHASTVSSLTGERAVIGTVDYLAPEQIEGRPVDGRVDVYGLGCVMYECLTGHPPFHRDNELASLLAHVNDPVPLPSERSAEVPQALDAVIGRALAKDRDERFATAGDLVAATAAALAGETPVAGATPARAAVRTFVFADVRGYTAYTREHGDERGGALAARFAGIVRDLAPEYQGHLQELRGDEALVVFDSARQALRFAVALRGRVESEDLPRPIGIGLDAGEAVPVEEGFRGGALNRAARLCALAKPGEVLATDAVVELAGKAEGVTVGFRRVERLKGFDKPVGVVEIHPGETAPGRELRRRLRRTAVGASPRRRLVVLGVVVVGGVVAAVGLSNVLGGPGAPPAAKSIVALDATSGDISQTADGGGEFQQIVAGDGVLYGMDFDGGLIATIDPATAAISARTAAAELTPSQVAPSTAFGSIWAADDSEAKVLRIDPRAPASRIEIPLPNPTASNDPQPAFGIAVTKSGIWAVYGNPPRIARIDPSTNRVVLSRKLEGASLRVGSLLASDGDALWAVQRDAHRTWRLDPRSGDTLYTGRIGADNVEDAAVNGGYLWVALETAKGVWKVDNRGTTVGKVETGELPWAVVASGGSVWVTNANSGTVTRIDTATDATTSFDVGHRPLGLAVADGHAFVSLGLSAEDARSRIVGSDVLTAAVLGDPIDNTDTSTTNAAPLALREATGARLMVYHVAADGTASVVPEIAAGPPTVSPNGLTYTFKVRKGFGFSPPSDEDVTAESLRYSIERARKQDDYCEYIFSVVKRIEARGATIVFTLNRATGDLAARVAHPCASAVPAGTPIVPGGIGQPIPSAGPYYPDTHVHGQQLVLLRNPNYAGKRTPKLDAIVLRFGYSSDDAAQAVERGEADFAIGELAPTGLLAPGGRLANTYGPSAGAAQRWFRSPTVLMRNIGLNYGHGPLRDKRLRQAISLALDRTAIATAFQGTPQSMMIPAGIPGHVDTPPAAARPAVARARALVAGRKVALTMGIPSDSPEEARVAELVKEDLSRIGISLEVRTDPEWFRIAADPSEGIDLISLGWQMDFSDPANAVTELLMAAAHIWFPKGGREPPWLRAGLAGARVTGAARARTFQALDRRLSQVDVPMVVHTAQWGRPVFFAERVGCQRFLPLYEGLPDLASLCLRDTG